MQHPSPFGDKYILLDRISVGGMAEVFRAKAVGVEGFARPVAVKRILPHLAEDNRFVEMFITEAKTASRLSHTNIAQVHELGRVGDEHFIAMEYVAGRDLLSVRHHMRRHQRRVPIDLAAWVAAQIAEGLAYAHDKRGDDGQPLGIVHRDVSPQNVLVSYSGAVKLIDFGIAKAASSGENAATRAGVLKGKFGYMTPEQIEGKTVDMRSDIFSLGAVLHELLTGERLFDGDNDFMVLERVREANVAPPSVLNPTVPPELDRICLKALTRKPTDRYQHASQMAEDLSRFVYSLGLGSPGKRLRDWLRTEFADDFAAEQQKEQHYRRFTMTSDGMVIEEPPDDEDDDEPTALWSPAFDELDAVEPLPMAATPANRRSGNPLSGAHVRPRSSSGMRNLPRVVSGTHPMPHSGARPLPHSGARALPHSGARPLPHSGARPLPHSGPHIHSGARTIPHAGPTSGAHALPMGGSGAHPRPGHSAPHHLPHRGSGPLPQLNSNPGSYSSPTAPNRPVDRASNPQPNLQDRPTEQLPARPSGRGGGVVALVLVLAVAIGAAAGWYVFLRPPEALQLELYVKPGNELRVTIDNTLMPGDRSPLIIEGLSPGRHAMTIERPGFKPWSATIDFDESQRLEVDLHERSPTRVLFELQPPDVKAEVRVNGRKLTEAERRDGIPLPPAEAARVEVKAEGYQSINANLVPGPQKTRTVAYTLSPTPGSLFVESTPPATVFIDDVRVGRTPLFRDGLDIAQPIKLRLEAGGHRVHQEVLRFGKTRTLQVERALKTL